MFIYVLPVQTVWELAGLTGCTVITKIKTHLLVEDALFHGTLEACCTLGLVH